MNAVRRSREVAGLSQADLSRLTGVAQPNIAAYESGRRPLSANMEQRLLEAIKERPSVILRKHRGAVLAIAHKHHASNIRVFGSIARGDDRPGSDIDLLMTFSDGASVYDQSELILDLQDLTGVDVDVVSEGGLRAKHKRILSEAVLVRGCAGVTRRNDSAARHGERTVQILEDMLSFAEQAKRLVARGLDNFENDEFLRLASEALMHRLGEAVARLPEGFIDEHPQISWRGMRGTRNIVSHNYDAVDHKIIWTAFSKILPRDAERIQAILADPTD